MEDQSEKKSHDSFSKQMEQGAAVSWTDSAWHAASSIISAIQQHPFVQGLKEGSLPKHKFVHYLEQDMVYLKNYGEEMTMLSKLMPTPPMRQLFEKIAADGVLTEKELHQILSEKWDVHPAKEISANTRGYMDYTRHYLETGDAALAIAALLPCFWVYNEIGHFIADNPLSEHHPYRTWIQTYKSEEMDEVVEQVKRFANEIAQKCSLEKQGAMRKIFVEATRWEYQFFNQEESYEISTCINYCRK